MIKMIILIVLFFSMLQARENPFFSESNLKQLPYTSNADKNLPPLKRAAVTLPSKARTIEKLTVSYKTLNGSLEEKSIILGNSIDWHIPIFISQNYQESETRDTKKNKPKYQVKSRSIKIIKKSNTVKKTQTTFKEIATRSYIKFLALDKNLKIVTKSEKLRDFLLVEPHRIVIDFKKSSEIRGYTKINPNNIFKSIKIGDHDGYYRVVIELDGYYQYNIQKAMDGYSIFLK